MLAAVYILPMILVGHGNAGLKTTWSHADDLRPLTDLGLAQTRSLVTALADDEIISVWCNPAKRCQQSVAPLAAAHGLRVTGRAFSEMLKQTVLRHQDRARDAAQVVAELVDPARHLLAEASRGSDADLTSDELAFHDAVLELSGDTLKRIAHDRVEIVRRDAETAWAVKQQVRAKLRSVNSPPTLHYGYPPDQEPAASKLVLEQAETYASQQVA